MFFLKQLVAPLLTPFCAAVFLLVAGLILLLFTRRQRTGRLLVLAATLILAVFGSPILATSAVRRFEYRHPAMKPRATLPPEVDAGAAVTAKSPSLTGGSSNVTWIAVLGTGYSPDDTLPCNDQIPGAFLSRFAEAARLGHVVPNSRLIVSVSGTASGEEKAMLVKDLCGLVRVRDTDPVIIGDAESTADEAVLTRRIAGASDVILVTSALHMPRALGIFKRAGIAAVPAPADYITRSYAAFQPEMICPRGESIAMWDQIMHELLGRSAARLELRSAARKFGMGSASGQRGGESEN